MKKSNFTFMLLLLAIIGLSSFAFIRFHSEKPKSPTGRNVKLTNPLLRYTKFKELKSFRGKLDELIAKIKADGRADEVSAYFRSLTVGIWIGINEREAFSPASILKVPVMMTYFRLAEKDPQILEKKIEYRPQILGGFAAGLTQESTAQTGRYYSVDELIRFMIIESDNNADLLLLKNLPEGALAQTFRDFGMDIQALSIETNFASLKTIATFLRVLYNASYLNETMSEKALRYLVKCTYRNGIVAGLPENITAAHKFGERFFELTNKKQLHEVAIVYYDKNPYLLAVMTKGNDYGELSKVIREISELTYREVSSQYEKAAEDGAVEIE